MAKNLTFRRYKDGDDEPLEWAKEIFKEDTTHKCPTYVHKTPPCQGSCPSGEDIRGWLDIVRGMELPPEDVDWKEYAFRRSTDANPFPSVMGRVCPAPCEDGCNRNEVEDHVGINSVEQFIGDEALKNNLKFKSAEKDSGKKVAIIGGGPAGLAAAYQLRRLGHGATIIDSHTELGGMMRYGIPGYRTPREVIDGEVNRILEMGVETRMSTRVGTDITMDEIEKEFDAVLIAIGAQHGNPLPVPGADASNCISGVAFLDAFNDGRLKSSASKVVVVGGGDTAMDVVSVAKRLGHIKNVSEKDRVENIVLGHTAHDVATAAKKEGAEVILTYRRDVESMPVAQYEIEAANSEGVEIRGKITPVEVIKGKDGRAVALRVAEVDWTNGKMEIKEGSEHDIECDLIVSAIGQCGDMTGMESLDNGRSLIDSDSFYQIKDKPGFFVAGDIIRPHLLTTAIGQASVACESIDHYLKNTEHSKRSKVDVHHFDLLNKLREGDLSPEEYDHKAEWGTDSENFAVHNYEDRSKNEIIPSDELFLGHFEFEPRNRREELIVKEEEVIDHYQERLQALSEEDVISEAKRCMSCGMCFECDNCIIYCPQDAVLKTSKDQTTTGRYVYTDYNRCIGCHICAEVCPTGYIVMGMGDG